MGFLKQLRNQYQVFTGAYNPTVVSPLVGKHVDAFKIGDFGEAWMDTTAAPSCTTSPNYNPSRHGFISLQPDEEEDDVSAALKLYGQQIREEKARQAFAPPSRNVEMAGCEGGLTAPFTFISAVNTPSRTATNFDPTPLSSKRTTVSSCCNTDLGHRSSKRRILSPNQYTVPSDTNCQEFTTYKTPRPYATGTSRARQALRWGKRVTNAAHTSATGWFSGVNFPVFGAASPISHVNNYGFGGDDNDFEVLDHEDCGDEDYLVDGSNGARVSVKLHRRVEDGWDMMADVCD